MPFNPNYLYMLYLPVINLILLQIVGRFILLSFIYPYQNSCFRENLDRQNNQRFGEEFAYYVKSFFHTLRTQSGLVQQTLETERSTEHKSKKSNRNKSVASNSRTMDQASEIINYAEM